MTKDELQESMEAFGGMDTPMLVSEIIPDSVPHIVMAGMMFVRLDDGMVSFYIELTPSGRPQLLPKSMRAGEECDAYWRLARYGFLQFEKSRTPGDEMSLLESAQEIAEVLSRTKLAALTKRCLLLLEETDVTLGQLDDITDTAPELV